MRLFVALPCPEVVKDALRPVQEELLGLGGMKVVGYENLHLTLKFLGEVDDVKVPRLVEALGSVKHGKFKVTVKGLGVFPNPGHARVVWAGVSEGFDDIVKLHSSVEEVLKPMGFPPDRDFHTHLTLARVKDRVDKGGLKSILASHTQTFFGSYEVSEYTLMASRLTPKGSIYSQAGSFPLM